jgi:hypothetical protein
VRWTPARSSFAASFNAKCAVSGNSPTVIISGLPLVLKTRQTEGMEKGFDVDRSFMLVEIAGDTLYFQTVSRTGKTVDSGSLDRQPQPATTAQIN